MIEYLDIVEILQNPLIDNIVSNMYLGPYERENFIRKSIWFKIIDEHLLSNSSTEISATNQFILFETDGCFKYFMKYLK